jgi:hypothetical protein
MVACDVNWQPKKATTAYCLNAGKRMLGTWAKKLRRLMWRPSGATTAKLSISQFHCVIKFCIAVIVLLFLNFFARKTFSLFVFNTVKFVSPYCYYYHITISITIVAVITNDCYYYYYFLL